MQYKNFITSPRETFSPDTKKFSYYKNGIRVKFPKKGPPLRVQILPAYNPNDPSDGQGISPCLVNGQPTAWFGMIQSAKFVGHGDWKSTLPVLSLASFEGKEPCPYLRLLDYCKSNPDWKYLVTNVGRFGAPDYQAAALKPVKSILLLNIIDVDNPGQGVQIGEFSYSIANALLNLETGIVFQRNLQLDSYPDAASALATNPMLAYANGDITDAGKAPVFIIELPPAKPGQFGVGYTARIEVVGGRVSRRAASDYELAERYHLDDPESFLNIPTGQDIVDELVLLLRGHRNAKGIDETCAIKEAVGDSYRVATQSAPGAVSSVQGFRLPPEEASITHAAAALTYPEQDPQAQPQPTVKTPPAGFAPNPAARAVAAAQSPEAPSVPQYAGQQMGIPGEAQPGSEADMAAVLAARMRNQLNLRQ